MPPMQGSSLLGLTLGTVVEGNKHDEGRRGERKAKREELRNIHPKILPAWKRSFAFYDTNGSEENEGGGYGQDGSGGDVQSTESMTVSAHGLQNRGKLTISPTSAFTPVKPEFHGQSTATLRVPR